MKTPNRVIPIFFAVDDNYAPYLAVAMRSLIDNASPDYQYNIYILIEKLSQESLANLKAMATDNVSVETIDVCAKLDALSDMLHLPHDGLVSGALNLDVDPRPFEGDAGHALFASILASYFNRGGLHAQVSSAKLSDLLDAQKDPASHRDLRVRVTGYSGVFVDIPERLQNDIIERFR